MGKVEKDYAVIGAPKAQRLVLSSNRQYNLVLNPDGSVAVQSIRIGSINHSSSNTMPEDDQRKGTVVWNSDPQIGQPIGWVSLGGARWAGFGTVTA